MLWDWVLALGTAGISVAAEESGMKTKPISFYDRPPGMDVFVRKLTGAARRIGGGLLHEVREAAPPTIFFFVGFNLIVLTTRLLAADYGVALGNFMLATLGALIVGKAVLVANKLELLRRYDRAPLIQPIMYKTAFYWVVVFPRLFEQFVEFVREGGAPDFILHLQTTFSWHRFFCYFCVGFRPVPDLCDGVGIQPSFRFR